MQEKFKIQDYLVDTDDNTVTYRGEKRHIEPKAMLVLAVLAQDANRTVARQHLLQTVWGNRVVVDEALTRVISQLRVVFDDSKSRTLIQTVPKKGYRLNAHIDLHTEAIQGDDEFKDVPASGENESQDSPTPLATVSPDAAETERSQQAPSSEEKVRTTSLRRWFDGALFIAVIVLSVLAAWWFPEEPDSQSPLSVAVLPLESVGEGSQTKYLAEGLSEELLGALSQSKALRVPSRYSTFAYARRFENLKDIARALKVTYLVEGTVREQANNYSVTFRLLNASEDRLVWSKTYESTTLSLAEVTEDAAENVTTVLAPALSQASRNTATEESTSASAYQAYMRGKYWLMNGTTGEWFLEASTAFSEAVEADPNYAKAYGSLAYIYARYNYHDAYLEDAQAREKARAAIEKALSLDPTERNALLASAILFTSGQQFVQAEKALNTVLSMDASDSTALYLFSELYLAKNEFDKALALARQAKQADPLSPWINVNLSIVHFWRGEYHKALEAANEAITVDAGYTWAYVWKAKTLQRMGEVASAIDSMEACLEIDNASPVNIAYTGLLYLELGLPEKSTDFFKKTAKLFGDSDDARFWKSFRRFGYRHEQPDLAIQLLTTLRLLDNRIFTLMPLLTSLYLEVQEADAGVAFITSRLMLDSGESKSINYLNSDLYASLGVLNTAANSSQPEDNTRTDFGYGQLRIYELLQSRAISSPGQYKSELANEASPYTDEKWWTYLWVLPNFESDKLSPAQQQAYRRFLSRRNQQRDSVMSENSE